LPPLPTEASAKAAVATAAVIAATVTDTATATATTLALALAVTVLSKNMKIAKLRRSVVAKIGSPLESDLSMYFLQLQKCPTDLFEGFPGNT
jgi:hypothetical protein